MSQSNSGGRDEGIGRIRRVALREVWRNEARDFTTWLENNAEVVADATGLQLGDIQREAPTGAFSVDLVAEDEDGRPVVVENQLERSDHDHLGKLITYLVGMEARKAVWIVADPRPEHVAAITWLNEGSSAEFYLLKLEAVRIGGSKPAPLLTQIAGPSEEAREAGRKRTEWLKGANKRDRLRYRFFEGLLERAKRSTKLHANTSPTTRTTVLTPSARTGLYFQYWVGEHSARVELYIHTGHNDRNQRFFDALFGKKDQIEGSFGEKLHWDPMTERQACRIQRNFDTGGWRDEGSWGTVHDELAKAMAKLEKALAPHLDNL